MKLKTVEVDGKTYAELNNGNPIVIGDNNAEAVFDISATVAQLRTANGEAADRRKKLQELEAKYGDLDPVVAREAIDRLSKIDQKQLIDAGEVDKVREQVKKSVEASYQPLVEENTLLKGQIRSARADAAFANSAYIKDNIGVPLDMFRGLFEKHVELDKEGGLVVKDTAGNPIYSTTNHGQLATFDEGMAFLVNAYPHKASILRGSNNNGTGTEAPTNRGNGAKTIRAAEWEKMDHTTRMAKAKEGYRVVE